jgi:ABC-type antimicrobial peptide transport system permease subunit
LDKLIGLGYVAISSYRTSAVAYDNSKVMARNKIVVIAILVLIIMSIFEIILIKTIFKMKRKDYIVLKSMGMSWKTMKSMNLYEMLIYTLFAVVLVPITAKIVGLCRFEYLLNVIKYYNILTFPIYVILNILVITVTIWSVDRNLKRKQKWS